MIEVRELDRFSKWFGELRDGQAKAKILARVRRLSLGNAGDVKSVGQRVSEMRIDHGPGYRLYFTERGSSVVILLCGGDKSSQSRDIQIAHRLAAELDR